MPRLPANLKAVAKVEVAVKLIAAVKAGLILKEIPLRLIQIAIATLTATLTATPTVKAIATPILIEILLRLIVKAIAM